MDKLRENWDSKVTIFGFPKNIKAPAESLPFLINSFLLQGRAVLVEILKKRARSKAVKAKAISGKRKGQGQGWRRGGKKKQRL